MMKTNETLNRIQADATVFYQKLRAYHWTVTGERFYVLHEQFEKLYTRWAENIDAIAERTVINGGVPVLTLQAALEKATIRHEGATPAAREMVEEIACDEERLVRTLGEAIGVAESEGDRGTVTLLDGIRAEEEKALWMLRAATK